MENINNKTSIFNISPTSIFIYFVIFCSCLVYFKNSKTTLGTLLGVLIAGVICFLLYQYEQETLLTTEKIHQTKAENIKPHPKRIQNYQDLTDFIFSVQDFYIYNPQAFIELIESLDTFLDVYESVMIDETLAGDLYSIAEEYKLKTLNSLHSFIITLPSSKKLTNKFDNSIKIYEELLNNYLYQIYEKNKKYIEKDGYFNNTKIIDLNISPYNQYTKDEYDKFY